MSERVSISDEFIRNFHDAVSNLNHNYFIYLNELAEINSGGESEEAEIDALNRRKNILTNVKYYIHQTYLFFKILGKNSNYISKDELETFIKAYDDIKNTYKISPSVLENYVEIINKLHYQANLQDSLTNPSQKVSDIFNK